VVTFRPGVPFYERHMGYQRRQIVFTKPLT